MYICSVKACSASGAAGRDPRRVWGKTRQRPPQGPQKIESGKMDKIERGKNKCRKKQYIKLIERILNGGRRASGLPRVLRRENNKTTQTKTYIYI